ncbi:hypothetical protein F53441_5391 [Fusarium austroafricanum]|uniref:Uncharacterized protein n=1 Tax=Fusarium austroafricanum TaxID=2364996 RepID=A0A8H4P8C4_9HYPO|nr:hypothetical protein F53441_5391 [Fusarium austroafricanum]
MTQLDFCVATQMEDLSDTSSTISSIKVATREPRMAEDQSAPSKASVLIPGDRTDDVLEDLGLDSRFTLERDQPEISGRAFSRAFLIRAWHVYTSFWFGKTVFHALVLQHVKADECPAGRQCNHWRLAGNDRPTAEEDTVELQLVCVTSEFAAKGDAEADNYKKPYALCNMFDDQEAPDKRITCSPCSMYNALKPDFGLVERAGYVVVNWRLIEKNIVGNPLFKWMDKYGRLLTLLACQK